MEKHPLQIMMERRKNGEKVGIPSYCTANKLVLEAVLKRAKENGKPVLIEATANQVNQFGGYTGMVPQDFYNYVLSMASKIGVPEKQIILAGDHLGPLTWQDLPESEAMERAEELVYQYTRAGFTKIHLDTSMKLADDPEGLLSTETIARRGARLYKSCMKAYDDLLKVNPAAVRPVFIIGSEVPIPGGAQEKEEGLSVTKPEDFLNTVEVYRQEFAKAGVPDGMRDVIAVVVQPGVEFGDEQVFFYDREKAKNLCAALEKCPGIAFEGHSTDYQRRTFLRQMVEDGIVILKVGPALTYSLRESLFALTMIERELVPKSEQAYFIETLEQAMTQKPENWKKHYHGSYHELEIARKYSYSDRARYYLGEPKVEAAIEKLFANLERYTIPMNMLHQYLPREYNEVRRGTIENSPKELALRGVTYYLEDYEYAAFGEVGAEESRDAI